MISMITFVLGKFSILNVCVPQNPYAEMLTFKLMVLGEID